MRAITCAMCGASEFRYENGVCVCEYCDTKYIFDGKELNILHGKGAKLTLVSVRFHRSYKTYDYIYTLEEPVHSGDRLIVNGFNGEAEVVVQNVRVVYPDELPMPILAYKQVLRKVPRVYIE